jgi:PAS domain S-box-containing protein
LKKNLESENKYRDIVETSVEGIWIFNAISETTYVNEKMAEMLGYNREEMIGRFIWDFAYEEDKGIFQVKLANRKQGIDEVYELELIRKDGSPLWLSVSAKGFFDDAGKFAGSVGMFTDITDRKRAEQELRESEERFRSAFDDSAVAMALVSPDALLLKVNDAFCRMLGFKKFEIEGRTFLDFTYPDDIEPSILAHKAVVNSEKPLLWIEKRYVRKDGRVIWCEVSSSPVLDSKGCPIYTIAHVQDITERKRAEETLAFERSQLLFIFDGIDDVVYVTDPYTYEVLYANKAMKEKFGGELVGGICYREFQRRDSPCDFCTNQIILNEGDTPYEWEYYNPTVDRYFMIMDRIIKWPDGRDVRFEIAKDITERRKAEEALKKHTTL